jgi:hypothetical protein
MNESLTMDKTYVSMKESASQIWYADVINTSLKQLSNIPITAFKLLEGNASASFFRDTGSTGGLINGTTLKGKWMSIRVRLTPVAGIIPTISVISLKYNVYP